MFCSAILLVARRWVRAAALALLAIPWLVLPTIDKQPFGVVTTVRFVSIEMACAVGVGLLGTWFSHLREAQKRPIRFHSNRPSRID